MHTEGLVGDEVGGEAVLPREPGRLHEGVTMTATLTMIPAIIDCMLTV